MKKQKWELKQRTSCRDINVDSLWHTFNSMLLNELHSIVEIFGFYSFFFYFIRIEGYGSEWRIVIEYSAVHYETLIIKNYFNSLIEKNIDS